mgnify:CR=1 FL=1
MAPPIGSEELAWLIALPAAAECLASVWLPDITLPWEGVDGKSGTSDRQGKDVIEYLKGLHEGWTDEIHYVLDSTPAASVALKVTFLPMRGTES